VLVIFVALWLAYYWLNQDRWSTFQSSQYHFSIDYPTTWTVNTYGERGHRGLDYLRAQFLHLLAPGNVQIHTVFMENPSLSDAVEWGEAIIVRDGGVDVSQPSPAAIGGEEIPAFVRTYKVPVVDHVVTVAYVVTRGHLINMFEAGL
jgi:hypothetical protein